MAANGLIAWELLESVNCNFDLVLTDVVMPFMSGIGLLSKMIVLEASKRIPVVSKFSLDYLSVQSFCCYVCLWKRLLCIQYCLSSFLFC